LTSLVIPLIEENRKKEHEKYDRAYLQDGYRMGPNRKIHARAILEGIATRGSLLDVGAGRGEMVEFAKSIGFGHVMGVEIVDSLLTEEVIYGEAHDLPFGDKSFDVVTSWDVFEHFLPEDTEKSLQELSRVASKEIILCIALCASRGNDGENYHINLRTKQEWSDLIKQNINGEVKFIETPNKPRSETWLITRN